MSRRLNLDDLYDLTLLEEPALSPDGSRVAYVVRTADRETDGDARSLWLVGTDGGEPRRLTRGPGDTSPAWSPDGTRLAFLRAADGPAQLWVLPVDGGEGEAVTSLAAGAGAPVWSPDGTSIAFAAPVDREAGTEPHAPMATDRLGYKLDGAGWLRGLRSHVHVVDLGEGSVRQVTRGDWHAGSPAWSPDGTRLAFAAAQDAAADVSLNSALHVVSLERRDRPTQVGAARGMSGPVLWTADGEHLVAVGREDAVMGHAGLLRVPLSGSPFVDLAAPLDRNVMPGGPAYPGALPRLSPDGDEVLFCVRDQGYTHLYAVPVEGGEPRCLVGGAQNVSGMSVGGAAAAVLLGTPVSYGEIATVDLRDGATTVLTAHSAVADVDLYVPRPRDFTVSDGTTVSGWLVGDPDRTGPAPLLVDVHGGPHNSWNGAADPIHLYHQVLAARGWTVLLLNPRGSDGYGEAFFTAGLGEWGAADAKDFLEPVDALVAEGLADPDRLAVAGYSYGGFMTCYLTSVDNRFAAAVTGGVVSDLTSMSGTSDDGHLLGELEFGALSWQDLEHYARISPITRVGEVTTPTLILHGAADERCPVGQAEQWFTALRERDVPTRLVLYPDGSHLFPLAGRLTYREDWNRRTVEWVEQYAGPTDRPAPVPLDLAHWQRRLSELAEDAQVPGAVLGILRLDPEGGADAVLTASHGVLNTATGVEVTDDSLFQIGSITKVWTATVVMQLVDEGLLDLDAPLVEVLPELSLSDPDVTKQVTMRHLLTHSSGIDGDVFTDTGRGDDCLEKYVARLDEAGQNHPLGATVSYCNSGYNLMGRVIERLTGQTWDQALRERLFAPLGLTRTVTLPEEALMHRAAVGHVDGAPAPVWMLPRSVGPAGLITATAADVLAFARMHLAGGVAADGTQVLSADSAALMPEHQVDCPDPYVLGDSWGLGWIRFGWDGQRVHGHDGNTIGQAAFLRLLPSHGLAVTLLTNGGHGDELYRDLYGEILAALADLRMPERLAPPADPVTVDPSRHVGVYERTGARTEVFEADGGLRLRSTITGPLAELVPDPVSEYDLVPVADDLYVFRDPGARGWIPAVFYALPTGERYLHYGVRANPKVG